MSSSIFDYVEYSIIYKAWQFGFIHNRIITVVQDSIKCKKQLHYIENRLF